MALSILPENIPKDEKLSLNCKESIESSNYQTETNLEQKSGSEAHSSSPKANATRTDVVCKSIIRGIKRYFCEVLIESKPSITKISSKEGKACLDAIEQVST